MSSDKKISELTQAPNLQGTDFLTILDESSSFNNAKILASAVKTFINNLSDSEAAELVSAVSTALHYHDSDRDNANQSGSPLKVSGTDPTIEIEDIDVATIVNTIKGADGNISINADTNNVASDSHIKLNVDGKQVFSFNTVIGGRNLLNARIGLDTSISVTGITHVTTTATATTAVAHNLVDNTQVAISGADYPEFNGTFTVTVLTSTTFSYTMDGDPAGDSGAATMTYLPVCLIIGDLDPTDYTAPDLLDAVAFGSIFLKFTADLAANIAHMYTKGEGPSPGLAPQWRLISSIAAP